MSRLERDFAAAGKAPPAALSSDQRDAIACYLSGGEGWSDALKALHGAFASEAAARPPRTRQPKHKHEINHHVSEYLQWPGLKSAGTDND